MDIEKQKIRSEEKNPFKRCQSIINDPEMSYIFGGPLKEKFTTALDYMYESITKLENDEKLKDFSYTIVEECLNMLTSLTIERPLTPMLKDLMNAFIFLAHNLNENTEKYRTVSNKIRYLQRYCDNAMTFSEYLSLMRQINRRLEGRNRWTPPSFRLSGHYYNLLKED